MPDIDDFRANGGPDPDLLPGPDALVGTDGNAYAVMGTVATILREAGASKEYIDSYRESAMSGDYAQLLGTSVRYITPPEAECECGKHPLSKPWLHIQEAKPGRT